MTSRRACTKNITVAVMGSLASVGGSEQGFSHLPDFTTDCKVAALDDADIRSKEHPGYADLGDIYERRDPMREAGIEGHEGVSPLVNAVHVPGEWQTMPIVFRAPRFHADTGKIEHARSVKVTVDGRIVQENHVLTGPTRSHLLSCEATPGPVSIRGNHGPVAIHGRKLEHLPRPSLPRAHGVSSCSTNCRHPLGRYRRCPAGGNPLPV